MGDPECQVILPRLKTDFIKIIKNTISNKLKQTKIEWKKDKSMTIVLCSKGYPGKYKTDKHIKNLKTLNYRRMSIFFMLAQNFRRKIFI